MPISSTPAKNPPTAAQRPRSAPSPAPMYSVAVGSSSTMETQSMTPAEKPSAVARNRGSSFLVTSAMTAPIPVARPASRVRVKA